MAEVEGGTATALLVDSISVINGKVASLHHPILWNQTVSGGTLISRNGDGSFTCVVNDPEHGESGKAGTLDEVLERFHPEIAAAYRQVFTTENPTEENLHAILPGFQVLIHEI